MLRSFQAPLDSTIYDFWFMIVQEKVEYIVMLTGFVEKGYSKSAQYFPLTADATASYDGVTVKCLKVSLNLSTVKIVKEHHSTIVGTCLKKFAQPETCSGSRNKRSHQFQQITVADDSGDHLVASAKGYPVSTNCKYMVVETF